MSPINTIFLFPHEIDLIAREVNGVTSDATLAPSAIYQAHTSQTFVPSTGAVTVTYTETTLGAIKSAVPAGEIAASDGLYTRGDLRFVIQRSDLPTEPNKEDRMVVDGITYNVVDWDSDPLKALWRIVARVTS